MYRLALGALVLAIGCDQTDNDRPLTLTYLTEAILQPSCAQYDCHSSFRMERGYAFDTIDQSRRSLAVLVIPKDTDASLLYQVLIRQIKRMPYDSPLPDKDIELIQRWIDAGAPGLTQ
jgi:hypothetical protein